jgi:hypothetical protein
LIVSDELIEINYLADSEIYYEEFVSLVVKVESGDELVSRPKFKKIKFTGANVFLIFGRSY